MWDFFLVLGMSCIVLYALVGGCTDCKNRYGTINVKFNKQFF